MKPALRSSSQLEVDVVKSSSSSRRTVEPADLTDDAGCSNVGRLLQELCVAGCLLSTGVAPIYSSRSSNSGGPIELQGRLHPAAALSAAQLSRDDDRRRGEESRRRESLIDGWRLMDLLK